MTATMYVLYNEPTQWFSTVCKSYMYYTSRFAERLVGALTPVFALNFKKGSTYDSLFLSTKGDNRMNMN